MKTRYALGAVLVLSACSARERSTPVVVRGPSTTRADVTAALRTVPSIRLRDDGFTRKGERVASIGEHTPDNVLRSIAVDPPRFADQPIVFSDTANGAKGAKLAMTALGARRTAWRLEGGTLVADDVQPSVDALWSADVDRSELFYVLRDEHAPNSFRFALDAKDMAVESEGTIAIRDGERVAMRIPRPFAIDANGTKRDAGMRLEGKELVVDLDVSGLAYPIVLDPGVETATWTRIGGSPRLPRSQFVGGEISGKFYIYSGLFANGGLDAYDDMWELSGTTWTKKLTSTNPGKRNQAYMAPLGGKLVLFGGFHSAPMNDTWTFDGSTWTQLSTPTAPPMRQRALFASNGSQIVLYGGVDSLSNPLSDTWVFNGSSWSQHVGTAPPPRTYFHVGGKIATGVLLAGGGNDTGTSYYDTWLWNGSAWSKLREPNGVASWGWTDGTKAYMGANLTGSGGAYVWNPASNSWDNTTPAMTGSLPRDFDSQYLFEGTSGKWAFTFGSGEGMTTVQKVTSGNWSSAVEESGLPGGVLVSRGTDPGLLFVASRYPAGRVWRRSGTTWSSTALSSGYGGALGATESGSTLYFATGSGSSCSLYSLASSGTVTGMGSGTCGAASNVAASATGDVFVGSARVSGTTWSSTGMSGKLVTYRGEVHALKSDGTLWKWNGTAFAQVTSAGTITGVDHLAAAGNRMIGLRQSTGGTYDSLAIFNGTSWRTVTTSGGPARASAFVAAGSKVYVHWNSTYQGGTPHAGTEMYSLDIGYDAGSDCTSNLDCTSGFCTDGVCCNVASCGTGSSCSTVTTKGTCKKFDGATCAAATECGSGFCEGGTCCKTACATSTTHTCNATGKAGTCLKRDGQAAASAAECASGAVADGVCCNTACTGTCRSCLAAHTGKAQGACEPVAAGTDPASECPDPTDVNSCGPDGYCNGSGACRTFAPETKSCGATTCASGTLSGPSCNGAGACLTGTKDCAPYQCASDGKTCLAACATAADCKGTGLRCDSSGKCVALLVNGGTCTAASECASNNCVDGVCCNNACDGQCQACNVAGSVGTCSAVKGAPVGGRAACNGAGTPCAGSCDGVASVCTYPSFGTDCGTTCTDGEFVERKCDNKGTCVAKDPVACNPFACGALGCKTSCTSVSDCAGPTFECQAGECVPGAVATCTSDGLSVQQDDKVTSCGAWRCRGGKCVELCSESTLDCAPNHICGDGKCVPAETPTEDGGGCAFGGATNHLPWIALAIAAFGAARRRRALRAEADP